MKTTTSKSFANTFRNVCLALLLSLGMFISSLYAGSMIVCDDICNNYGSPTPCSKEKVACHIGDCGAGAYPKCAHCICQGNPKIAPCKCLKKLSE